MFTAVISWSRRIFGREKDTTRNVECLNPSQSSPQVSWRMPPRIEHIIRVLDREKQSLHSDINENTRKYQIALYTMEGSSIKKNAARRAMEREDAESRKYIRKRAKLESALIWVDEQEYQNRTHGQNTTPGDQPDDNRSG